MKNLILILFLFFCVQKVSSQTFYVLSTQGKVEKLREGKSELIADFMPLYPGDMLRIDNNSKAFVVDSTGNRSFEIKKSGQFSLFQIEDFFPKTPESQRSSEGKMVLTELASVNKKSEWLLYQTRFRLTIKQDSLAEIKTWTPFPFSRIPVSNIQLKWHPCRSVSHYRLEIFAENQTPIWTAIAADTFYHLSFKELNLKPGKTYYFKVSDRDYKRSYSNLIPFTVMNPQEQKQYEEELISLQTQITNNENSFNYLILANFFEKYQCFDRALFSHNKAISLFGSTPLLKKSLAMFYARRGMTFEARMLYNPS